MDRLIKKYTRLIDFRLRGGDFIRKEELRSNPFFEDYAGTLHYADSSADVVMRFSRNDTPRILGPVKEDDTEYRELEKYLERLKKNDDNGYEQLLKQRRLLRIVFFMAGIVIAAFLLKAVYGLFADPSMVNITKTVSMLIISWCFSKLKRASMKI